MCVPKRGSLKAAGKHHFPATQLFRCCTAFFLLAAAQLSVKMASALQKNQCCSPVSAAQHSEIAAQLLFFACGLFRGVGFRGVGFRTC